MKKLGLLTIFLIPISAIILSVSAPVYAVDVITNDNADQNICNNSNAQARPSVCGDNQTTTGPSDNPLFGPNGLITNGVQLLLIIVGIVSVFVMLVAGIKFILSGGDAEAAATARRAV